MLLFLGKKLKSLQWHCYIYNFLKLLDFFMKKSEKPLILQNFQHKNLMISINYIQVCVQQHRLQSIHEEKSLAPKIVTVG